VSMSDVGDLGKEQKLNERKRFGEKSICKLFRELNLGGSSSRSTALKPDTFAGYTFIQDRFRINLCSFGARTEIEFFISSAVRLRITIPFV
jgi:hypothetical protein